MAKNEVVFTGHRELVKKVREIGHGVAYHMGGLRSFVTQGVTYKVADRLEDVDDLEQWAEACRSIGIAPAGSWSTVARKILPYPYIDRATRALCLTYGIHDMSPTIWSRSASIAPAERYDINRAYQWSTMRRVAWTPGAYVNLKPRAFDKWDVAIARCHWRRGLGRRGWRVDIIDRETPGRYDVHIDKLLVAFRLPKPDPSPALESLRQVEDWPERWKSMIMRCAWGTWSCRTGPVGVLWREGKEVKKWQARNSFYDPVRAYLVAGGVRDHVIDTARQCEGVVRVYVDSITCQRVAGKIEISERPGAWRRDALYERVVTGTGGRVIDYSLSSASRSVSGSMVER